MDAGDSEPLFRIGELARRAGIPPATLRAWERRYGIVSPRRTDSGYRLYSEDDERRLKSMLELITVGIAPAQAAQRVRAEGASRRDGEPRGDGAAPPPIAAGLVEELRDSLLGFDEHGAHRALDRAIAAYSVEGLVGEVVLPVMRQIGERWQREPAGIGQEHFATNLVRARLLALSRGWGRGGSPHAMLACPPGEQHDLGLIGFGLVLRDAGWRITFFGADTPLETLEAAAGQLSPDLTVLAATSPDLRVELGEAVRRLKRRGPVLIGGARASEPLAAGLGAEALPDELSEAARMLAGRYR